MKQYVRHILYYTVCIVFLVLALMALWMFTAVKEGFEGTAPPFLVLVGKTSRGDIYYADVDVPFTPKWHRSSLPGVAYADATRAAADAKVAAAVRKAEAATTAAEVNAALAEVNAALAAAEAAYQAAAADVSSIGVAYGKLYTITGESSIPKISSYDAATSAPASAPALKQVYIDDDGTIGGIDAAGNVYYGSSKNTNTLMKSVAFSGTNAYGVGTDGSLYFTGNPGSGTWTKTNTDTTWKQVVLSGPLACAINTAGNISYAFNDITTAATKWKTNSGPIACPTFSYISLLGRRLIGVGTDTNIYYTDDVTSSFLWRTIPIKVYEKDGGELGIVQTISGSVRTSRQFTAPVFTAIELMYPDPSARRKRFLDEGVKACNKSETLIGNYCYQPCPDGQIATGTLCPYMRKHIPAKATCPAGTTIINNTCFNPCSSNYTTLEDGSTVANYTEDPANNQQCLGATIPKKSSNVRTPAKPASVQPCNANNGALKARYIRIRPSQMHSNNKLCLKNVTVMGYKVDSEGVRDSTLVNLSSSGSAFSTDGICASGALAAAPVCAFKSGSTYDKDEDGGKINRMVNTYWELDLHAMHYIKSVDITGCFNSSSSSGSSGSSSDETSLQMNGVRLEILKDSNGFQAKAIAERTLGPNPNPTARGPFTQTVTFRYGEGNVLIAGAPTDTCYDVCPMFGGVQSVPLGNGSCTMNTKHISKKSITMPQIVRPQTLLAPADLVDANGVIIPTEWTADPTDITQFLTCSMFPGSSLHSLINRTIDGHTYVYLNPSTGRPNPNVSGYVCVQAGSINASMCPRFTSDDNGHRPDLLVYKYDPATFTCYIPKNVHRHWNCRTACAWNFDNMSCNIPADIVTSRETYCCTGMAFNSGRAEEQRCWRNTSAFNEHAAGLYGKTKKDNYALPSIPGSLLRLPVRMPGRQGCFDSAGNKTDLFLYNNSCAKCMGAHDTYYAKGLEVPRTSVGPDYGIYDNQAFSTSPIPTLFADDYVPPPSTTAPTVNANNAVRINEVYGDGGLAPTPPPLTEAQKASTTILAKVSNGLESAATFFSSLVRFKPSGNPARKYVHDEGSYVRILNSTDVGSIYSSGICVGKCDKDHSKEMPLQMHVVDGKYVLWGAACESESKYTIKQSSIPAEFTPASESKCPAHSAYNSSDGLCYTECNTLQIDNGTTCTYKSVPRPYVSPTYSCTNSSLTLAGSVCLYGCKEGTVANGAYCDPVPIVLPKLPTMYGEQVIMCNKTPGGKKSGKDINKWLCEDSNNAYLLVSPPCNDTGPDCIFPDPQVTNPNVPYSYIGPDDIICHADSSGSTVYVCQSPSDYINSGDTAAKEQANSQMTCDNLSAAYLDLSSNLTVLTSSGKMAQTSATRLANMQATLQGVYNVLCGHSTPLSSCPTLQTQIAALKSSINSGSSTLADIINPYEMGMSSRTMLVGQMNSMGCTIPK